MSKKTNADAAPAIDRAILDVIGNHKGGACLTEVSAALRQVTAAVQLTGKGGKVTLEMSLRPASKSAAGTLIFETRVKSKVPEADAPGSIFYANDDYNLVRDDPNQKVLDLRVAGKPTGQAAPSESLRKVDDK